MKKCVAIIFFHLLFLVQPLTSSFICENSTDCQSLLKFKQGITNDPNGYLHDWNSKNSICNWTGITCHPDFQYRVIAIQLIHTDLEGVLSPFLSNLSVLTTLDLQRNSFHGNIPSSFGLLSELSLLNLSYNNLQGGIPESLQGCQSLQKIELSVNNISGSIPEMFGRMQTLTYLALAVNRLTGIIPSSLSNLTELRQLKLSANYLSGKIPIEFGLLTKLEIVYLHTNYLEGSIPASLSNCTSLQEISLSWNRLTGEIPGELGKLQNLQKIYFTSNNLSGQIPVTLSNLSQLTLLDLSLNILEGEVPPELGKLRKLQILYLHTNNLVSRSNSSIGFLTALTNCSYMQKLHLGSCLFAGSLPPSMGHLSKDLYYFNLLNNHITGEIPDGIGNLTGLVNLNLFYNFLDGTVPAALGKLGNLQRLYLGRNKLTGLIPDDIGKMGSLGFLDLSDNLITGSIPSSIGKLSQLRYLYLSRNNLSGNIPIQLSHCSLLMLLDLSFNDFRGSVPTEIGLLSELSLSLNLSNNKFEREIPASIGNLVSALAIDLSENRFSGFIPSSIGNCISLEYLNLSNNKLEGTIPDSIKRIRNLGVLDLAFNRLSGTFPSWLADDLMIKYLNVSYNKLTGEVPKLWRFFKNVSKSSFMGNVGLCGGTASMGLPSCEVQNPKSKKWILYVVVGTFSGVLLLFVLLMFIFCCCFRKDRDLEAQVLVLMDHHGSRTFTQRELEIATNGFDEANLLGKGGFGSVYKATIDDGKSVIAVKVLNEESRQSYMSLKRECQILSGIKHRNLVRMVGSTWNSQFQALVLEYIGNGNLEQHLYPSGLEKCELTLREKMAIAIDIAHGLEYLHEGCTEQIIHCDLKPENVLLDMDLVAKVADFGIGKIILTHLPDHVSTTWFLRGSIGYIPPEYGQGREVSAKGDVYSFGIMLLEMITEKRPTNEMFRNGLNLRNWVNSAYPSHILDVVSMSLREEANLDSSTGALHRLEQCCIHMIDTGLMCTDENPQKRPLISIVAQRLKKVWEEMGFETLSLSRRERNGEI